MEVVWAKSAPGVWGLGHVFDGKLYFTRDIFEEKWIPKDLVSPKKLVAAPSCLHQGNVPQFALKYPCKPPPPPGRPSFGDRLPPPHPGDRRALTGEIARGVRGM